MVARMDAERFGGCTNHGECEGACPKSVGMHFIARLNRDLLKASLLRPKLGGVLHAVVEA
jgi:succinate dehydrogenase / fumarate reductase iron-sulfur subunit